MHLGERFNKGGLAVWEVFFFTQRDPMRENPFWERCVCFLLLSQFLKQIQEGCVLHREVSHVEQRGTKFLQRPPLHDAPRTAEETDTHTHTHLNNLPLIYIPILTAWWSIWRMHLKIENYSNHFLTVSGLQICEGAQEPSWR